MTDHDDDARLPLSSDEQRVLDLYDALQRLRLEIAIINALASNQFVSAEPQEGEALLDARAMFKLRNDAVEAVMTANPILKAVHGGRDASPVEHDLLPYVQQRDEAALSVAQQAAEMGTLRGDSTKVQVETASVSRNNVELAAVLCDLAQQVKQKRSGTLDTRGAQSEMARLEDEVKSSRQRWRVMKGVVGGVVSGSGIDWARDDELRDAVLDTEKED